MDTRLLSTFIEVAQRGSLASAARHLDLDPSLVSRHIALLEQELGARVFQRSTRKISLTEAGQRFFARAKAIHEELEQACLEAKESGDALKGNFRLTASLAYGNTVIAPLFSKLRERFPELKFDFVFTDSTLDLVQERIDLAIRLGPSVDSSLIAQKLVPVYHRVVASPRFLKRFGKPSTPAEISALDCLRLDLPGFRTHWKFRNKAHKLSEVAVHGSCLMSNALSLRAACLQGLGLALLPNWMIAADLANRDLIELLPEWDVTASNFDTHAWLLYPSRAFVPMKVRAVMEFFRSESELRNFG
jgi:DNA-binding transcriptional LysR family regulator